ncbi:MAG: tRNA guanosine(34) transglycosylase Tgt [Nanoarchaeota archaeon]|nr:tRNA guanosine(34) transglycosylase Tgt [Nanoarchaeota archaeon]
MAFKMIKNQRFLSCSEARLQDIQELRFLGCQKSKGFFSIIKEDKKTKARIGIIETKKGPIETPFFMPVATKMSVKFLTSEDLKTMPVSAVISNTFVLHLNPGEKLIKKMGGIGKFMNYNGINATDSGGFQMYSDKIYEKSNDKGVFFKNPSSNERIFITPEKDMEIQLDINSDIAMCLDEMPSVKGDRKKITEAVRKTVLWAERCKIHHDKLQKKLPKEKRQLLWGIIQGGLFTDLREKCAKKMVKMDFDGYSIGGLALGEPKNEEYRIVKFTRKFIPKNKPVYLMGVGSPDEIVEAVSQGVDMFDSRFPTQNARHGTIFTSEGKLRIKQLRYFEDKKPLDKNCNCFVCKNYSRSFIRYQLKNQETVGMRLCTYHNIFYLQNLMRQCKEEIRKGTFNSFKKKIMKLYS